MILLNCVRSLGRLGNHPSLRVIKHSIPLSGARAESRAAESKDLTHWNLKCAFRRQDEWSFWIVWDPSLRSGWQGGDSIKRLGLYGFLSMQIRMAKRLSVVLNAVKDGFWACLRISSIATPINKGGTFWLQYAHTFMILLNCVRSFTTFRMTRRGWYKKAWPVWLSFNANKDGQAVECCPERSEGS